MGYASVSITDSIYAHLYPTDYTDYTDYTDKIKQYEAFEASL